VTRLLLACSLALGGCGVAGAVCDTARECLFEGAAADRGRDFDTAIDRYTRAIGFGLETADMFNRRGSAYFKAGRIKQSIEDFDRAIEIEPRSEPGHWQRGISHYYAERFEDGRAQFELHQTVNPRDVENGVWHFLCAAKVVGVEEARKQLLPISGDPRVPMTEVYQLFRGQVEPDAVVAAAGTGDQQLFYAHLYLGLYFEAMGEEAKAAEHIRKAADEYPVGHYMWEVARVHRQLRGW
jgi:lipoprotein NlpI